MEPAATGLGAADIAGEGAAGLDVSASGDAAASVVGEGLAVLEMAVAGTGLVVPQVEVVIRAALPGQSRTGGKLLAGRAASGGVGASRTGGRIIKEPT